MQMNSESRVLAQNQFNELVKKNIDALRMKDDDAVEYAVKQLVAQGVSLDNVIPDVWVVKREDPISRFSDKYNQIPLATTIGDGFNVNGCLEMMKHATRIARERINYRLYAGDCGVDDIILSLARMKNASVAIIIACLESMSELYSTLPGELQKDTVDWLLLLYGESDESIKCLVLKLLRESSISHEINKNLLASNTGLRLLLDNILQDAYSTCSATSELLLPALGVIRNLCKNSGISAPNACNNSQILGKGSLSKLYDMVEHQHSNKVRALLLEILASLAATDRTVCEIYNNDKQFSVLEDVLNRNFDDADTIVSVMKLLKALSDNNEEAKTAMRSLFPLVIDAMNHFLGCSQFAEITFALIAKLTSRNQDNATAFGACNAVSIVLEGMRKHRKIPEVLRSGCLALRNLAPSCRNSKPFEIAQAAEFIREIMTFDVTNSLTDACQSTLDALRRHDHKDQMK